ncbi:hypothetical protein CB0940_09510 [Cercospora beticola]|uniref:Uncharacterized protein n=1 Tax=Cercospora beticola TaxID=122368 RepID=A0A2G5HIE6_CERBT|nr:hypothetical protein CB0940_09510 [Cercospora beticola]PIA91992.1 hypothetical protein CB0940_09510 [Cercospora beticola]WPB06169.1 hypothetical protein RHO25_010826 [Cercospora beticola]
MAQPVLVKAYTDGKRSTERPVARIHDAQTLPPISSYAFADILRSVDGNRDFQLAIDGIAEICAKTRLSLADEYGSHMPPLGEITVANATLPRPQIPRPGMRRVLTSVPEASSGSSEGSRKSTQKRASIFSFRKRPQQKQDSRPMRRIRISSMGRSIPVGTTTAMAGEVILPDDLTRSSSEATVVTVVPLRPGSRQRAGSAAQYSLQRLLAHR